MDTLTGILHFNTSRGCPIHKETRKTIILDRRDMFKGREEKLQSHSTVFDQEEMSEESDWVSKAPERPNT